MDRAVRENDGLVKMRDSRIPSFINDPEHAVVKRHSQCCLHPLKWGVPSGAWMNPKAQTGGNLVRRSVGEKMEGMSNKYASEAKLLLRRRRDRTERGRFKFDIG